jgi:hypothetical protein
MPLYNAPQYPDPLRVVYFEDFLGTTYDNRIWAVSGTGAIAPQNSANGRVLVTGNAANSYRLNHGNMGSFTVGNNVSCVWHGSMTRPASGTGGLVECGLQDATAPTTTAIKWSSVVGGIYFQCICINAGTATTVMSNITVDTADHDFRIEAITGSVNFYLDGVLKGNITTNIPAGQLQPFCNCTGSTTTAATFNADSVLVIGIRA